MQNRIKEHYNEACEMVPHDRIIGIFCQGSQNYQLAYEDSDLDTKVITLPDFSDIIFNKPILSTTHVRANDEHIDFKDLRLMLQVFKKQNINFIEILFTKYKILNPMYEDLFNILIENNERIAKADKLSSVRCMMGMANEKYKAIQHPFPSKIETLAKYGYDPKQLHHIVRLEEFMRRYTAGEPYAECLISTKKEELIDIKRGLIPVEKAIPMAQAYIQKLEEHYNKYKEKSDGFVDKDAFILLDTVQYEIMKRYFKNLK